MAEWQVEAGIGEDRALLIEHGQVLAARLQVHGALTAGEVADAVLTARQTGSKRGTARFASGEEVLVSGLPREASEGASLRLIVTRAGMAERGRFKRAQARLSHQPVAPAPSLTEGLGGRLVRQFEAGWWEDVCAQAQGGTAEFSGGALTISPTPAMTVIDVDGTLPPRALALAAVPPLAAALRQLDLAGSIAIDFPTLAAKADRHAVDAALALALADWPHERTAMNGFGLVHLVARLERPSLLQLWASQPMACAARLLLRAAERISAPGILLLSAHPALHAAVRPDWHSALAQRSGRIVRWALDPALAPNGGFAQAVAA